MAGIAKTYAGGKGTVRVASGKPRGLRNKRKAYWAKIRMAEMRKRDRRERQRERAEQYDFQPHYDY